MRRVWALATVILLTGIAGVAVATTDRGGASATLGVDAAGRPSAQMGERAAVEALARWNRFPVNGHPRPIVVPVGPGIVDPPHDQREDLAAYRARWTISPPLPSDVATAQREGLSSPAAAIGALREGMKNAGGSNHAITVRIRLGQASFVTDRGWLRLPAWQFYFGHFRDPASVLAVESFKSPPLKRLDPAGVTNSEDGEQAVISADELKVTIFFTGGPAGNRPCDDSYSARVRESRHAVAFTITELPVPASPGTICTAVGQTRNVVVRLARRLGARVLVDSTDGGAIPVARRLTFK
jgi:hypothetical protein